MLNLRAFRLLLLMVFTMLATVGHAEEDSSRTVRIGDILQIVLPGEESLDGEFQVNREGIILLPEVGGVEVAGLPIAEAQVAIRLALGTVFRDLSRLTVIHKEHRLVVRVLGYVATPGMVNLPEDAGVQMALQAADGVKSGAQLDRLQIRRHDSDSVEIFDYKRYLDSGDESTLPQLQPLDTIFVPSSPMIGNVQMEFDASIMRASGDAAEDKTAIKVFGEVLSPGSFSFKTGSTVVDMLMRAGGVTRYASVENIRVIVDGEPEIFNLKAYLDSGSDLLLPEVQPGSTVFVPIQVEEIKAGGNMVYVIGEVFKPGAFEGKDGATFMDILANAGGPTRFAEARQIRIIRGDGTVARFDLGAFTEGLKGSAPPPIFPGDAIFVPEKTDLNEKSWLKVTPDRAVRIFGTLKKPGRYEWSEEMSLMDLIAHAGGPAERANTTAIRILTRTPQGVRKIVFNLDEFLDRGGSEEELPLITPMSTVYVPELPEDPTDNKGSWIRQASAESIYIFGEVGAPGRYAFDNTLHFLDILAAADGPKPTADLHNIRVTHRGGKQSRVSRLNLSLYFETGDESLLPKVRQGDTIYVPDRERNHLDLPKDQNVIVLGAVSNQGIYPFDDTSNILDLLAQAGGHRNDALIRRISIVNYSRGSDQARTFDLKEFSVNPDPGLLPVIRPGDTVYVPEQDEGRWSKFTGFVQETVSMISMLLFFGAF